MSMVLTVNQHWADQKRLHVIGTIVLSGSYAAGGETIVTNRDIKSTQKPQFGIFNFLSGYRGVLNAGKLKIFVSTTGVEVADGAYPGALTGDTITAYMVYPKYR